jgi:hypothetical protein
MPELVLGLAPNKSSYFDKVTNFYLTLSNPVQKLVYTDYTQLDRITHALLASVPALRLYEGNLPQESIDAWKSKFDIMFRTDMTKKVPSLDGERLEPLAIKANRAFDRADHVNDASADLITMSEEAPEQLSLDDVQVEQVELLNEVEQVEEAKPKRGGRKQS